MKTIITGSRYFEDPKHYFILIDSIKKSGFKITEVFCGGATGIDTMGDIYASVNNIPVRYFHADWKKYGRKAGPMRNESMCQNGAGGLILIWNGRSPGSGNMLKLANKYNLKIFERIIDG